MKTEEKIEPASLATGSQMMTDPIDQSPLNEIQNLRSNLQEEMSKRQLSSRLENLEPNHDSKSTIRNPLPTVNQDPESGMQVKIRPEQSSRMEEIREEIVNNEQMRREELSSRLENLGPNHDSKSTIRNPPPTVNQNPESGMQIRPEQSSRLDS